MASLQSKYRPEASKTRAKAEQLLLAVILAFRARWPCCGAVPCASACTCAAVSARTVVAVALVLFNFCATRLFLANSEESEESGEESADASVEAEQAKQSETEEGANDDTSNSSTR